MKHNSILTSLVLLHAGVLLPAQTWSEVGSAGNLPRTAQVPVGNGALTSISGNVNNAVDMYAIQIDDTASFLASTVGGASFDTQLFLFDEQGRGVTMRDDVPGFYQSTITGQFVPGPGRYYLAITPYNIDPTMAGLEIWASGTGIEHRPDGARRGEIVDGWNGSGSGGNYTIALAGVSFPGQQVVLPDNHHLSGSPTQVGAAGSTLWWRSSGGRFQLLYDASHFTSAGVTGPVALRRLMFRGEDGEPNVGGVTWVGAAVQVGATSLTPATMSTTFLTNRAPVTTTLGPAGATDITVMPSTGATPNDYNIVIDLTAIAAGFAFDPTSARPNLLIDITLPSAANVPPSAGAVMAMQATTGGLAVVRGRGIYTSTFSSLSGTDSTSPLVLGVEFAGTGGEAIVIPARNEFYGAACGGQPSSFYQTFLNGQPFDIAGLRLVPNDTLTPVQYSVDGTVVAFDASKVNASPDSTADDAVVTKALGFTFRYPGGSTSTIRACTNGFVWLDGVAGDTDYTPAVSDFLGATATVPARLAPFWCDLNCGRNTSTHPNSGLHVVTDLSGGPGNGKCYVTWLDVGIYNSVAAGGQAAHRMQCVLYENGTVEYRYGNGTMPRFCAGTNTAANMVAGLVGFSRGTIVGIASVDPQSRDLSLEVPFSTFPEGSTNNIGQTVVATPVAGGAVYGGRAFAGQTLSWNVNNVPAGTLVGVQLVDVVASRPGFQLPTITAPGCMLSTSLNATLWEVHVFPSASVNGARSLAIPAGFDGTELYAQYVVLGGLFGAPDLITSSSNAVREVIGKF